MLEDIFRPCVLDFKVNWDEHLPQIEFSCSNNYHLGIGMALFRALYEHVTNCPSIDSKYVRLINWDQILSKCYYENKDDIKEITTSKS